MTRSGEPKRGAFSAFRSAAEEAQLKKEQNRDNEGGHMTSTAGRVVCTPEAEMPYKVILTREGGGTSEHAFSTMQEAEAFIRRNTPLPPARSTLHDHDAGSTGFRRETMDDETAHAILDVRADTVALRGAVKMLLRRTYGIGDDALGIIRDDALASVETAIEGETDERQRYFHQAVREAVADLLTPLSS